MRHPTTETRWPARGAQIVVLGASRARSESPQDRAEATVKLTDDLVGDWPRWSLKRVGQRIQHSWVLTAVIQSVLTWAIAAALVVALWFALTFFLSL